VWKILERIIGHDILKRADTTGAFIISTLELYFKRLTSNYN